MFRKINDVLQLIFGIRVAKTGRKIPENISIRKTPPIIIEFVGASGVGKTTLFKALKKRRKMNWLALKEFVFLNREDIPDGKHPTYEKLAKQFTTDYLIEKGEQYDYLSTIEMFGLATFFYNILKIDLFASVKNSEYTLISDEGLFHNYRAQLEKLQEDDFSEFKEIVANRAVVYCYSSSDKLYAHIKKRQKEEQDVRTPHRGLNDEQLLKKIQQDLLDYEKFTNDLKALEIPILSVDTGKKFSHNVTKVNDFIKTFR